MGRVNPRNRRYPRSVNYRRPVKHMLIGEGERVACRRLEDPLSVLNVHRVTKDKEEVTCHWCKKAMRPQRVRSKRKEPSGWGYLDEFA